MGATASAQTPQHSPPAHRHSTGAHRRIRSMGFRWGCQNQQRASAEQSMEGPTLRKEWWARTRVTAGLLGLEGYRVEERAVCEEQGMSPRVGKMLPLRRAEPPRASTPWVNGTGSRSGASVVFFIDVCLLHILLHFSCKPRSSLILPLLGSTQK